jgi:hypothetical protein
MSLFGFKVCLATEVNGVVTLNEMPVANAKVMREIRFQNKARNDEVLTDANGNFLLPGVYDRTVWKYTPFEVVIAQFIHIEYENKKYLAFRTSKSNFDVDGELNSPIAIENGDVITPFVLTCELTNEEWLRARKEGDSHAIRGICLIPGETIKDKEEKIK